MRMLLSTCDDGRGALGSWMSRRNRCKMMGSSSVAGKGICTERREGHACDQRRLGYFHHDCCVCTMIKPTVMVKYWSAMTTATMLKGAGMIGVWVSRVVGGGLMAAQLKDVTVSRLIRTPKPLVRLANSRSRWTESPKSLPIVIRVLVIHCHLLRQFAGNSIWVVLLGHVALGLEWMMQHSQ